MASSSFVPADIQESPSAGIEVKYPSEIVKSGNELTPTLVKDEPSVKWEADGNSLYTLIMTDVDCPPPINQVVHWLVGNIPGNDIKKGEVIVEYLGSGPPKGTGLHRYLFLVYKQSGKINFDEKKIPNTTVEGRRNFSFKEFAAKYSLNPLIAGNFFKAQFDDYVPIFRTKLGLPN